MFPVSLGVGVLEVDPPNGSRRCGRRGLEREGNLLRPDRMARQGEIGQHERELPVAAHEPGIDGLMASFDRQHLRAQIMQQLEGTVGGLGNAVDVQQPEPAVERY